MLQEQFLKQLNPLHYLPRQNVLGRVGGRQLSKRKGSSLDFAEHRNYMPGDDYRYIDWSLYGRLDRLFVRVFARERRLSGLSIDGPEQFHEDWQQTSLGAPTGSNAGVYRAKRSKPARRLSIR